MGRRVLAGERFDRPDILRLVQAAKDEPLDLLHWAARVRTRRFGNAVKLCAIVPGKLGGCGEDCRWCAQSGACGAEAAKPSRTGLADIRNAAGQAAACGAASFGIVNSGRRPSARDLEEVAGAFGAIRRDGKWNLQCCASLGELTDAQARRLVAAGITRYNHNLETSRRFFPQVVTTHTYEDRMRTLVAAREAGLSLCCGGIFGLGETWEDRIDLALALRDEVGPDVVPMNFLHPIPGTALEKATPLPPMEILSIIALFRLVLPGADLKIAGGREANLRDLQSWMFHAGGTSCVIGNYLTTCGRKAQEDLQMIRDLGLRVVRELPKAPA